MRRCPPGAGRLRCRSALAGHRPKPYDMSPDPDLGAAALAYEIGAARPEYRSQCDGQSRLGKTREPLRVAEEVAWLDNLSDGRLTGQLPDRAALRREHRTPELSPLKRGPATTRICRSC